MLKQTVNLVWTLALAFCVIVQSVGSAAGGVLCLGCTNPWGGVAVANAPCGSEDNCCSSENETHETPVDQRSQHDDDDDCGCVDVTLSQHAGTIVRAAPKALMPISMLDLPATFAFEQTCKPSVWVRDGRASWPSCHGPPTVPLLDPSGRRTILHI